MCHRRKAKLGVDALTIALKKSALELGLVICDDMVWDTKSVDNQLEEGNT
jgi:hypothetical protein